MLSPLSVIDPFRARYDKLNDAQRRAVDTVYGPVMVIAGPGTGKTEVLALRIAALLRSEAQVQPQDILCLSYSEEAAVAMRQRLVKVIGPAAHRISICTFHGFCNGIIASNPEYFPLRAGELITDLERADLMRAIVDDLPEGHPLRRYGTAPYWDIPNLSSLFEFMKREAVTPDALSDAVDTYLASLPDRPDYQYQTSKKDGSYKKGDLKQALYDKEVERMEKTRAGARLFGEYTARMQAANRYDYSDMILWVVDAFKTHADLLQRCQERYQFVLVDEFQDTNGAQLAVVNALCDYWDEPNIFVVGDDDQSIYEFQGARLRNIVDFYERYKETVQVVVLPANYRSSQPILDRAGATIVNNQQRLIRGLAHLGLTKDLVAAAARFEGGADTVEPQVVEFVNPVQEEVWVVEQIAELQRQGVDLSCVAVIYAQHKQSAGIIGQLERRGIPFCAKKPANVLDAPLVQTVVGILRYLQAERTRTFSGEALLFGWMHAPALGLSPADIATMALYLQSKEARERAQFYYRQLLDNPMLLQTLGLAEEAAAVRLGSLINRWLQQSAAIPVTLLLEEVLYESGLVARTLQGPEAVWDMQALRTFFDWVKTVCTAAPRTSLADIITLIDRMDEEGIPLSFEKIFQNDRGVNFYTAHGAKGHEFEHVFLVGAAKQFWEKRSGFRGFKLPDTLTNTADNAPQSNEEEVARRLFYVALTRAKKHLTVSYATESADGTKWDNSLFVDEISTPEERIRPRFSEAPLLQHLERAMQPVPPVQIHIAQRRWIDRILQQSFTLSASTLNKFLRCPVSFYYENLLRVPVQGASHFAFGTAVHHGLERLFVEMRRTGDWPPLEEVVKAFERAMYAERESMTPAELARRLEQGRGILAQYYAERLFTLHRDADIELKVSRYYLDDSIPVTGRIDKLERYPDGTCVVVDYKTGKAASAAKKILPPNDADPLGGDYWRQMVFYKIILEGAPGSAMRVKHGYFDLLEKDDRGQWAPKTVPIFDEDVAIVKAQIKETWLRIQNGEFDEGCGEPDCAWCDFARRHALVRASEDASVMDDV